MTQGSQATPQFQKLLEEATKGSLLRFSTAGSVDDGKSTLIGRLLHDSKNIYEDQLSTLQKDSKGGEGGEKLSLALVTDGLKAEREQGITIDVAYRYFSTPKRRFILADTPGHEQYTRNMATGASTADLTIVLIDASKGVVVQTKRHAFIASLMGVPRLLVAINKMDLAGFDEGVYTKIRDEFEEFASRLGIKELRFIPVSALKGDNIVRASTQMPWFHGETIMEYLENVYIGGDINMVDFRFPVQGTQRPHQNYRGYSGQIASGIIHCGDEIMALPSMKKSRVKSIDIFGEPGKLKNLPSAQAPRSVTIVLEDEIDIGRGDMIVRSLNAPSPLQQFEAMLVWMSEERLDPQKPYLVRHTTRETKLIVNEIAYRVDVNTLSRTKTETLALNEIGRVSFTATMPLFLDSYRKNRSTGNFILIDPGTYRTVAAGMVIDRLPQNVRAKTPASAANINPDLHEEKGAIDRKAREERSGHRAKTIWFTGLSGSGKSTLAKALEQKLFEGGRQIYRLDGDNLRGGLNKDLGFSAADRTENIRRVAEVARLFNEAGVSVICAFISPYENDRRSAREVIGAESFVEVYLETPLEVCESRDPHSLYKKARAGKLKEFTGVSAPYEPPKNAELVLNTANHDVSSCLDIIMRVIG